MDEQQPNKWEQWSMNRQDSSNSPYYNQPTHSPYLGQGFAVASLVFGILAIVSYLYGSSTFFLWRLQLPLWSIGLPQRP